MYALLLTLAIGCPCDSGYSPDEGLHVCQAWPPCGMERLFDPPQPPQPPERPQLPQLPEVPVDRIPGEQVCAIGRDGPVCHLP